MGENGMGDERFCWIPNAPHSEHGSNEGPDAGGVLTMIAPLHYNVSHLRTGNRASVLPKHPRNQQQCNGSSAAASGI
jgi:hypothetical protein